LAQVFLFQASRAPALDSIRIEAMDLVSLFFLCYRSKFAKENSDEALCYFCFALIVCFAGRFVSDHAFSAVITLGAAIQLLGFCLLRMKMRKQKGAAGMSSRTLQMFAVMYVFRLYSTLQYNGYLPVDRSGDWAYQLTDLLALGVVISILVSMHDKYSSTYEHEADTCQIGYFIVGCVVLSCFVHPDLNRRQIPDIAWTAALYMEAVSMVPQLYMMAKKGGEVESLASHYIACVFVSRLLMITFWLHSYPELLPRGATFNFAGYGVVGAQLLQIVLFGDFMYYYVKSIRSRTRMVLPQTMSV